MKGLSWLAGLLSALPLVAYSSEDANYPNLTSGTIRAAGVEMHRLLCPTCGKVRAIDYVPERNSFFLSTDQGDIWQVSAQGHLVDVIRGPGATRRPDTGHSLRLSDLTRAPDFSWTDSEGPLYLHDFHPEGRRRKPFFDFNSHGWSGVYGQGRFVLKHQGTELRFSAYHARPSGGGERSRLGLYRLNAPEHGVAEQLAFLVVRSIPYERNTEQLGVYLLRPHPAAAPPVQSERYQQLNQRHELSLEFDGFDRYPGKLSRLYYVNGWSEEFGFSPLDQTYAGASRPAPLGFHFSHQLPGGDDGRFDYLEFNGIFYRVGSSPDKFSTSVTLDEQEVYSALSRLNLTSPMEGPVTLVFRTEVIGEVLSYRLSLRRGEVEVPMRKAALSAREITGLHADNLSRRYDEERIKRAFEAS